MALSLLMEMAIPFSYFIQQNGLGTSSTSSNTPTTITSTFTSIPSGSLSNFSPTGSSSTPTGNHRTSTDAIIGGVIGGLVFISLLLALFFFNRKRNNRRSQTLSEMSSTVPSTDVVNPFISPSSIPTWNSTTTFLPQNYTSNGQSLSSQFISSKFTHQRGQPSDPASTGSSSGGGIPLLTPLQLEPQFSSPSFTPSGSSPLPLTGSQTTNLDNTRTRVQVPQAETEPSMQRSPSPQRANVRILRHDDSGVRIPAEDDVLELPPFYTPE